MDCILLVEKAIELSELKKNLTILKTLRESKVNHFTHTHTKKHNVLICCKTLRNRYTILFTLKMPTHMHAHTLSFAEQHFRYTVY